MKRRGFSVVELAVVIALISIVSLLLFAGLRSSQISARDDERRAKAEIIASALESLHKSGNSSFSQKPGLYPNIATINTAINNRQLTSLLPNIDDSTVSFTWSSDNSVKLKTIIPSSGFVDRSNTENMLYINPLVGLDQFVYEPLFYNASGFDMDHDRWSFCQVSSADCRRFNLYYRTEADNTVHVIRSTQQ